MGLSKCQSSFVICQFFQWCVLFAVSSPATDGPIMLAGQWRFQLDPADVGLRESWFARDLPAMIALPGALQAQGHGDEINVDTRWTGEIVDRSWYTAPEYARYRIPGNIKVPFWLQPDRHYVGAAWYQRDIEIPESWNGKRLILTLERPHWATTVFMDGKRLGTDVSLSTPHVYQIGTHRPGRRRLTIRVDNRLVVDVGINSHSVSDHTQGNWNGIAGKIELSATSPVWVDDLQVFPNLANKSVTVRGRIGNTTGRDGSGVVIFAVQRFNSRTPATLPRKAVNVKWERRGGSFETEYPLGDAAETWDEFRPTLFSLTAQLEPQGHARSVTFGFREISTEGSQLTLNGRPIFIRGTLECAIFPKTGCPPTDLDSWLRIVRIAKAHGLNNIRFHSWCPPEAAFEAADMLGFYYLVECASWANTSTKIGVGLPIDKWLYDEADRILQAYGNHPSFVLMAYGNEPAGDINRYLGGWVNHYRAKDPRRLYTGASGWPQIPENQFHVAPDPRIQAWGAGLKSRINALPPETQTDYRDYIRKRSVPVMSHEIGQWCVYPNFEEIPKYTGYLKPKNFEIFRETLVSHSMGDQARELLMASGKLQVLCYKEDIESALRTPGMGGFQLLDLHDFPGQGTALVGVLDPFWESKGYVTAEEYSRFCNSTVPLARLSRRVFTTTDVLEADLEVAHFGEEPLKRAWAWWRLIDEKARIQAAGETSPRDIPLGNGISLGSIRVPLADLAAPSRYCLVAGIAGMKFENDWDIWIYSSQLDTAVPAGIAVADSLDDDALRVLRSGGRVMLAIPPDRVSGDHRGKVATGFSSIFWNTAWTRRQPPHTLGILCDPGHPALADFPTEYHSNWQWWYLITRSQAMILEGLPDRPRPIVQMIDDWFTNRRLGLIFEAKVEGGRLLACSIDLKTDLSSNPVARQLRHSLLRYMDSDRFNPTVEVSVEQIRALMVQ